MKTSHGIIKNEEVCKEGIFDLVFSKYINYQVANCDIAISCAAVGHAGTMFSFVTGKKGDVISTEYQFVPGIYYLTKENGEPVLYDETAPNIKSYNSLLQEGSIVVHEEEDDEDNTDSDADNELYNEMVEEMTSYETDTEEENDESDEDDDGTINNDIEENDDEDSDDFEEQEEDEEPEEEQSRSLEEIREIVAKKKNIDYVGVHQSHLPTENGPTTAQAFDGVYLSNQDGLKENLKKIEEFTEKINEDEEKYQEEPKHHSHKKDWYDQKKTPKKFPKKNRDFNKNENSYKNSKKDNYRNKNRLTKNDLDHIVDSMYRNSKNSDEE